ncbi:MAG: hypothetical protein AAF251_06425 [Pseudomonadota bacterium]
MGKPKLNVLVSFAPLEREVTGERIRDKVAASKAKGMGGNLPIGYNKPRDGTRTLVLNDEETSRFREIFARYPN